MTVILTQRWQIWISSGKPTKNDGKHMKTSTMLLETRKTHYFNGHFQSSLCKRLPGRVSTTESSTGSQGEIATSHWPTTSCGLQNIYRGWWTSICLACFRIFRSCFFGGYCSLPHEFWKKLSSRIPLIRRALRAWMCVKARTSWTKIRMISHSCGKIQVRSSECWWWQLGQLGIKFIGFLLMFVP